MEKRQRVRAPNFTANDNILLVDIVTRFKNVIENKKTDGPTLQRKNAAWLEVAEIYNSCTTGCTRTVESLQQTYKNLKKKAKKNAFDAKTVIPEESGTSTKGWLKVAENTGIPEEICQKVFAELRKQADTQHNLKKLILASGGGPTDYNDVLLQKVKSLVTPDEDGICTIYDVNSEIMVSQDKPPIESDITETGPEFKIKEEMKEDKTPDSEDYFSNDSTNSKEKTHHLLTKIPIESDIAETGPEFKIQEDKTPDSEDYFSNDSTNSNKKTHHSLTRKRKLGLETTSKVMVSKKNKKIADMKLELVEIQRELLTTQLENEKQKLEHNHRLRKMEEEEVKRKYEHNEKIRKLELKKLNK